MACGARRGKLSHFHCISFFLLLFCLIVRVRWSVTTWRGASPRRLRELLCSLRPHNQTMPQRLQRLVRLE
jgi:hypothetical protein